MNRNSTKKWTRFISNYLLGSLVFLFGFFSLPAVAQVMLIDSLGDGGFETGPTFAANNWTVANYVSSVNKWTLGTITTGGMTAPFAGNRAFISNDLGLTNNYDVSASTSVYFYRDVVIPAGAAYIPLKFLYVGNGEASWDHVQVYVAPTSVVPVGGLHPGSGTAGPIPAAISGATQIGFIQSVLAPQYVTMAIPSAFAGTTVRLIFMWKSDVSLGTNPAGSIDDISLFSFNVAPTTTATALGGLWSSGATWVGGAVPPPATNVVVPAGSIVTVDQLTAINNLDIDGTVQWNATNNAMTLGGNLTINASGKFLPYTTAVGGSTGVTTNIAGSFTNNGYANLAVGTTTNAGLNFNGPTGLLTGSGTFEGTATRGIIRALLFGCTGGGTISTTTPITSFVFANSAGNVNTGGALRIDNTAQIFGRPLNTKVASVAVTAMGSLYTVAPVVFGGAVTQWNNITGVLNTLYVSGTNVYRCTAAASIGPSAPTHTSGIAQNLLWIGTTGTIGNPFLGAQAHVLGTQYFYGGNLYTCIVAGIAATATPPTCVGAGTTCVSGAATFRYAGTPAQVSVNYDATTQTVRSLNIVDNGIGYSSSAAPLLTFSVGVLAGTGSGALATPVILYNLTGTASSSNQRSGIATFSGGLTINSDQGASVASTDPQASSGVGNMSTANGGVNYTVAPQIAFGGPLALNLITNPGSGYTVAPTITVTGGNLVAGVAYTSANFLITVQQGKVASVYLNTTAAVYSSPPTLTMSAPGAGVTATLEFPVLPNSCWPSAVPTIGNNGQILGFTITNPGFGYHLAPLAAFGPTSGTAAGGTFTTAATAPTCRIASYNLVLNFFSPAASAVACPDDVYAIPTNRKINQLQINGNGNGLVLNNDITLYGATPYTLTASLSTPGNIVNLNSNTVYCSWNGYAGSAASTFNSAGANAYFKNGTIKYTGRGGAGTFNYPFAGNTTTGGLVWVVGTTPTPITTGCSSTTYAITELGPPTNATFGTGAAIGARSYRARLSPGAVSGTNPTVTLHFNSLDGLTVNQDQLFVADAAAQSGPWTLKSTAYGAGGALPAVGFKASATVAPGPILATPDYYYAFAQITTLVTSFTPSNSCGGGIVVITGSGFIGATAVTFGGTPALSFVVNSGTQITAVVSNSGSTGLVAVTAPAGTGTSAATFTFNGVGPVVSILEGSPITICPAGSQLLTALPTGGGERYSWSTSPGIDTFQTVTVSPVGTTVYTVTVTNSLGCANAVSTTVNIAVPPAPLPTATPAIVCAGSTSQLDAGTFISGSLITPILGGNGFSGNAFNITAINTIKTTYFSMAINSGTTGTAEIWYKPGGFPGPTLNSSAGWTLIGSVPYTSTTPALAPYTPTLINLNTNITIPAGQTYGFAIAVTGSNIYTNGTVFGAVSATNADLTIQQGCGGSGSGGAFSFLNSPRNFNGSVAYVKGDPLLTYAWSESPAGSTLSSTSIINPLATPTAASTIYTVTATSGLGCTGSANVTVTLNPVPVAPTITGGLAVCGTTTTTLTASMVSPSDTIEWFTVATGGTRIATGPVFTTPVTISSLNYWVSEKTAGNCTSPRTPVTVVWNSPPALHVYNLTNNDTNNVSFCGTVGVPVVNLNATSASAASWAANGSSYSWSQNRPGGLSCVGTCTATNAVDLNSILPAFNSEHIILTVTDPILNCVAEDAIDITAFTFSAFNANALPDTICAGSPTTVSSGVSATTFAVSSIPYAGMAVPGSGVTVLANAGIATPALSIGSLDDGGWYNIPIPFAFNYFGNTYSACHVSTNGNLQFGATGTFSTSFTPGAVPSPALPNNYIALFWTDLYLTASGTIRYWTSGFAPNRVFVVDYSNVPGFTTAGNFSGQVWLYETTGIVECHVTSIADVTHNKVCGVEDLTGTIGSAAPGRNSVNYSISTPEAWRFTPPVSYTFAWSSNPIGYSSIFGSNTISPTVTTEYYVLVTDAVTLCTKSDSVRVVVKPAPTLSVTPSSPTVCNPSGVAVNLVASGTGATYAWSPATGLSGTTGPSVNALPTVATAYTVTATLGGCTSTATANVGIRRGVTTIASASPALVCPGGTSQLRDSIVLVVPTSYCSPVLSSGCGIDYISNVTMSTINNSSTCGGVAGINLFATPNPTLNVGTSYPISVTTGGDVEGAIVWIDYGQSGTFTSDEIITHGYLGTNPATYTGSALIPATALNGPTRMRVRCNFANDPFLLTDPSCDPTAFGEVEDYVVTIAGAVPVTYTYDWTANPTYLSATNIANPIAAGVAIPQNYSVTATASNGCFTTSTVAVNHHPVPSPVVITTNLGAACVGQGDTLTASGGIVGVGTTNNYTWNPITELYTDAIFLTPYVGGGLSTTVYAKPASTLNYSATSTVVGTGCVTNSAPVTVAINPPGVGGCTAPPRHDNVCYPVNVTARITTASPYTAAGYAAINTHSDTVIDNNTLATFQIGSEPIGSCGTSGINNKTLWYRFRAPFCATPTVHISTDDRSTTNFNTRISVYRRAGITCSSPYTEIACNDDATYYLNTGATSNSTVILTPNSATPGLNEYAPGEDLYIQASGVSNAYGSYGMIVDLEPYVPIVSSVGAGTAIIDWNAAMTSPWGGVLGTYIQWRPVGSGPTVAGTYKYVAGPLGTTTLTGLLPGTAYEYWASYICGNGGRWWSKKGTFTTSSATCTGGTSPSIVSIVAGTPCNQPVITFNATSSAYSSYRVIRKDTGSSVVLVSAAYYTSPTAQTYTSAPLTLGRTYQFYVLAYCGTARVDSSAMVTYTTCASLRMANPNATQQNPIDEKDVAYILPNGDVVYGIPFNAIDLQIDVNNPNAQEITIKTMDAAKYFGKPSNEDVVIDADGDVVLYPNPANTEATLGYSFPTESASMNIQVIDAQGKEIMSDQVSNPGMTGEYKINLNKFSAGVYFVKVQAGEFIQTRKLMVETK